MKSVYYPNLIAKVTDVINQHERQVTVELTKTLIIILCTLRSPAGLTSHNGAIPVG